MSSWTQFRDATRPPGTSITFPAPTKARFSAGGTERQSPRGPCGYRQETPAPFPNIPQGFTSRGVDTKPLPQDFPPALAAPCTFHACCIVWDRQRIPPKPSSWQPLGWRASWICWAQHTDHAGAPGSFQFHQLLPVLVLEASRKAMSGPQRLKFHRVASKRK